LDNTSSLPDGGNEQATTAQRPPGLGGGDQLCSIVSLVAQALVVGEDPPQLRIVTLALISNSRKGENPSNHYDFPVGFS
jgi:hypothetical protein